MVRSRKQDQSPVLGAPAIQQRRYASAGTFTIEGEEVPLVELSNPARNGSSNQNPGEPLFFWSRIIYSYGQPVSVGWDGNAPGTGPNRPPWNT